MHAKLIEITRLSDTTLHHAFTAVAQWQDRYVCAYREAASHHIVPRGHIVIETRARTPEAEWWHRGPIRLRHPTGDCRDPKFLVTPDVLYCYCGIYLPHPAWGHLTQGALMLASGDNILQTHICYTTDGETWSEWRPILRPNYWGWSTCDTRRGSVMLAYHTGSSGEPSSITLWATKDPLSWFPYGTIFDGPSHEDAGDGSPRYSSYSPSEPVVWWDADADLLGCALRTGDGVMQVGVGAWPWSPDKWRWRKTGLSWHPSAVLQTPYGWVLAAREITTNLTRLGTKRQETTAQATILASLDDGRRWEEALEDWRGSRHATPLLTLPSSGDTGYAGLTGGEDPETIIVSWYSQHEVPRGLPGAAVYIATVEVSA